MPASGALAGRKRCCIAAGTTIPAFVLVLVVTLIVRPHAIAEIDVEDRSWVKDYVTNVTSMVERHGGRYLARTAD